MERPELPERALLYFYKIEIVISVVHLSVIAPLLGVFGLVEVSPLTSFGFVLTWQSRKEL